jgi:hypothetical protein
MHLIGLTFSDRGLAWQCFHEKQLLSKNVMQHHSFRLLPVLRH